MSENPIRWSLGARLSAVFFGLFLALNGVPLLLFILPGVGDLLGIGWILLWSTLMPTLGNAVFGIDEPISTMPAGSSDMTWNYVQQFWYLVIAAVVAIACVVRVRQHATYDAMHAWFRIIARYSLAEHMFSYGLIKVFGQQMRELGPLALERTFAESSPQSLLWTFMGFSPTYQTFTGLAEVVGAALLLSRRTTTLGALIIIGVMANVVMMNFCFDVPVKIYSSVFLLAAVYLAAPDLRRIVDVFVRGRSVAAIDPSAPALGRGLQIARMFAKVGFIIVVGSWVVEQWQRQDARQDIEAADKPVLYGAWEVERFELDGQLRPASQADPLRWRRFTVADATLAVVFPMHGESRLFALAHDEAANTLTLSRLDAPAPPIVLDVARPSADALLLTGSIGISTAEILLRHRDTERSRLMTRGFHWVQEVPYN
jgi:hypothetical protein